MADEKLQGTMASEDCDARVTITISFSVGGSGRRSS